jgi:hypothetical protein
MKYEENLFDNKVPLRFFLRTIELAGNLRISRAILNINLIEKLFDTIKKHNGKNLNNAPFHDFCMILVIKNLFHQAQVDFLKKFHIQKYDSKNVFICIILLIFFFVHEY